MRIIFEPHNFTSIDIFYMPSCSLFLYKFGILEVLMLEINMLFASAEFNQFSFDSTPYFPQSNVHPNAFFFDIRYSPYISAIPTKIFEYTIPFAQDNKTSTLKQSQSAAYWLILLAIQPQGLFYNEFSSAFRIFCSIEVFYQRCEEKQARLAFSDYLQRFHAMETKKFVCWYRCIV